MANVIFKRGLQANLPNQVEDGVFYLTTDTNRLYIGQSNGTSVDKKLLNQTVQIVPTLAKLAEISSGWGASASQHINDFYYVTEKNIFAVYTGTGENSGWQQINPDTDTTISSVGIAASSSTTNNVQATVTVTDSNSTTYSGSVHFVGDGTAHVSVDAGGNIKILGDSYSLQAPTISADNKTATVTLHNSDNIAAHDSSLILESGNVNTLAFSTTGNKVILTSQNTNLAGANASVGVTANNGTLSVSVTDSDSNQKTGSASRVGVVLNDGTFAPITSSADGTSTGALYSKAEIDSKLAGLDGMTYKGTVGTSGGATVSSLPTSNVKNGDTYVVITKNLTTATLGDNLTFDAGTSAVLSSTGTRIGDMFIAKGTENSSGIITSNLTWTYIPAGNEELSGVTYRAVVDTATHAISLWNGDDDTISKHVLVAGTDVALSSAKSSDNGRTDNVLTTTINHATITTTTPTAATTASNGTSSFTAIKELTISNGHVTAITTDTFTPVTYDLDGAAVSSDSHTFSNTTNTGTNGLDVTIRLKNSEEDYSAHDAVFNLTSSSIKLTADANDATKVVMNLEWGAF